MEMTICPYKMCKYFNFVYLGSLILRIYLSRLFKKLKMIPISKGVSTKTDL